MDPSLGFYRPLKVSSLIQLVSPPFTSHQQTAISSRRLIVKIAFKTLMLTRCLFMFEANNLNSDAIKWAKTVIHQLSQDTCINLVEGSEDNHEVVFTDGDG